MLYESLHEKLLKLSDAVEVYPAHGAGSLCGRNISKETSSTIGEQRRFNYALRPMSKDEFIKMMTSDLPETPRYFAIDARLNREGAAALDELPIPPALSPAEVSRLARAGDCVLLDVRQPAAFGNGHVPGALNIGLKGQFASWAGSLIPPEKKIIIIADDEDGVHEAVVRLARVGLENVAGYLDGGMPAWDQAGLQLATLPQLPVDELYERMKESPGLLQIIDVRQPGEYLSGHVPGAINIPLARLEDSLDKLDPRRPTPVICAGGYRSSAAVSILGAKGFHNLYNVVGGTSAWIGAGYETEQ
jgi:rhodanese-related sulfurtransferase